MCRNTVVIFLTIAFFLQPNLTQKGFGLLNCVTIYEDWRLQNDLEILCWQGVHRFWAGAFALPVLLICFSLPIVGSIWLIINRKRLQSEKFKSYFIFFYQGLMPNRAYWEFCNIIRKMIVIGINVFVPRERAFLKLAAGLSFLLVFL
jgi:hypothetical protein